MPSPELKFEDFQLEKLYNIQPEGHPLFITLTHAQWRNVKNAWESLLEMSTWDNLNYIFENGGVSAVIDRRLFTVPNVTTYSTERFLRNWIQWTSIAHGSSVEAFLGKAHPEPYRAGIQELYEAAARENPSNHTLWYIGFKANFENILPYTVMCSAKTFLKDVPSLLKVIAHYKRQNVDTYFRNPIAEGHSWLWSHYRASQIKRQNIKKTRDFFGSVSKRLGYAIVPVTYVFLSTEQKIKVLPRNQTKGLHTKGGKVYHTIAEWNKLKTSGTIEWCSRNKDWYEKSLFLTFYTMLKGKATKLYQVPTKLVLNICTDCEETWVDSYLKPHTQTELPTCPVCLAKKKVFHNPDMDPHRSIGDYHSHKGTWRFLVQRIKDNSDLTELPIGIEIEVQTILPKGMQPRPRRDAFYADNPTQHPTAFAYSAAYNIYAQQREINPDWNNFYCEWDGSLMSGGFEVITNPMTMRYHQEYWTAILPIMRKFVTGWYAMGVKEKPEQCNHTYGIHLTCHTKYWKDLWLVRLAKFCADANNKDFIHAMAQRATLYGGGNFMGQMHKPQTTGLFTMEGKNLKGSARSNVFLKRPLVEIRMFRSTLNTVSFLKNVEFLTAFWHWCKSTPFNTEANNFLNWLASKETHEKLYPHLLSYLSRKQFTVKNRTIYTNPFQQFMKKKYTIGQGNLFDLSVLPPDKELQLEDEADLIPPCA